MFACSSTSSLVIFRNKIISTSRSRLRLHCNTFFLSVTAVVLLGIIFSERIINIPPCKTRYIDYASRHNINPKVLNASSVSINYQIFSNFVYSHIDRKVAICTNFIHPRNRWTPRDNSYNNILPDCLETFLYDKDCSLLRYQGFNKPVSREEVEFPIAFSLVVFRDIQRITRLLRAIYRTTNIYCIHIDKKSENYLLVQLRALANCFDNVFIAEESVSVEWGKFGVLEAELVCLRELLKSSVKWKYFINLTGHEFPLKTNKELVEIFKAMNGTNDVLLDPCTVGVSARWRSKECSRRTMIGFAERWIPANQPRPHNIFPYKGQIHVALSREMANFSLHDQRALDFLEWIKKEVDYPDEMYFSSLNSNPHLKAPGSNPDPRKFNPSVARFKIWRHLYDPSDNPCPDHDVRAVCILSLRELTQLTRARELFANKFLPNMSPFAYECLESWFYKKILKESETNAIDIDVSFYKELFSYDTNGRYATYNQQYNVLNKYDLKNI